MRNCINKFDYLLAEAGTVSCLTSDHGEMLADRGTTAKSKPWMSAMSVPLICSGPGFGIAQDAVVHWPVTTLDLGEAP